MSTKLWPRDPGMALAYDMHLFGVWRNMYLGLSPKCEDREHDAKVARYNIRNSWGP